MPRQNRRRPEAADVAGLSGGFERRDTWQGEVWVVRAISGQAAVKAYRCPGCQQEIRPAMPHVVAWPAAQADGDGRRHWHRGCWDARERRR